jgi:hypothetical protein
MTPLDTVRQTLQRHGWLAGMTRDPSICCCEHKIIGSGAVFFQSVGLLWCNECSGWQQIRKPYK